MVSMHMGIASMVLLQAVRAGWTSYMCGQAFLCPCDWFAFATCGVSPCHNGNGHE